MGSLTSLPLDDIRTRGSIRDSDVLRLRRAFADDQAISTEDAEALLALDAGCAVKDPSWAEFLVDALSEHVVHQAKPEGYIEAGKARWLLARVSRDGRIDSHTGLDLLVNVLDRARWSPPSLVQFALGQVRLAVVSGAGPLRSGQGADPGSIGESEVALVRRLLLAFGGDCGIAVTRAEADALVEIDRAIAGGKRSPAWTELYVKAVGNAVLSGLGHAVPVREEALRPETWPGSVGRIGGALPGGLAGHMIAGGAGSIWASARLQSPEERALARLERQRLEIITSERIEDADEAWLLARFDRRPDAFEETETALLAFVEREASALPASIRALAAHVRVAA